MRLAVAAFTLVLVLEATAADLTGTWQFLNNPDLGVGAAYVGRNPEQYLELSCDVTGDGLEMLLGSGLFDRAPGDDPALLILIVPGRGTYSLPFRPEGRALLAALETDHPLIEDLRYGSRLEVRTATGEEISRVSLSGSSRTIDQLLDFCAAPSPR